jgi:hypothetical protein
MFRTDRNNNPAAFTTDIAIQGGLVLGKDFTTGDPFVAGSHTYYTAKLLGDPVMATIKVIDAIGFYNKQSQQRWVYIGMPKWIWDGLAIRDKVQVVRFMYEHEGGTELRKFFV